jgi:aminobenzoyl-glutamate utilization protein B
VGDVSWIVPTVQCHTACFAIGTPFPHLAAGHARQAPGGAQGHDPGRQDHGGDRRRRPAQPRLLARAKAELRERTGGKPYVCPIPEEVTPEDLRGKDARRAA